MLFRGASATIQELDCSPPKKHDSLISQSKSIHDLGLRVVPHMSKTDLQSSWSSDGVKMRLGLEAHYTLVAFHVGKIKQSLSKILHGVPLLLF